MYDIHVEEQTELDAKKRKLNEIRELKKPVPMADILSFKEKYAFRKQNRMRETANKVKL